MMRAFTLGLMMVLAGCAGLRFPTGEDAAPPQPVVPVPAAPVPGALVPVAPVLGQGVTAAALDQTTEAERVAAVAAPAEGGARELGTVSVTLGSPAEQGFWLKSALVDAPGTGRVVLASGASVAVDLLPGSGAGLLSLAAYRALGLGLTDLPEVTVFAD